VRSLVSRLRTGCTRGQSYIRSSLGSASRCVYVRVCVRACVFCTRSCWCEARARAFAQRARACGDRVACCTRAGFCTLRAQTDEMTCGHWPVDLASQQLCSCSLDGVLVRATSRKRTDGCDWPGNFAQTMNTYQGFDRARGQHRMIMIYRKPFVSVQGVHVGG
jgi:hypothetical protein